MQTVFSKRRRWSTFQVVVFVIFLLFGNLLLLNKTREHYEKDYQLKLGEYKYKQSVLQRELDSAKALRIGGNANDDSPKKTGGVRHAAEDNGGVAQTTTHQPPKQPKNEVSAGGGGRSIEIEVFSSQREVYLSLDGVKKYEDSLEGESTRGIHVIVLNEVSGAVVARRIFDTYVGGQEEEALIKFLNILREGRIIIFTIKDEGTSQLTKPSREFLAKHFASREVSQLEYRSTWAFVCIKGGGTGYNSQWFGEALNKSPSLSKWAKPVILRASVPLLAKAKRCVWGAGAESRRRAVFCDKYEGYDKICHCENPEPIDLHGGPLSHNLAGELPIAVVAANRPAYLFRMLKRLLKTPGVNRDKVTVYIDGFLEEPKDVVELFGVAVVEHEPICSKNCRISQHYKRLLRGTFDKHPSSEYMIILEEDLDVSVDIMDYFSQLVPVMDKDPSVYCISAWNDQGYKHSSNDPSMLYRVETMPGLGWVLKKKLFVEELEPKWPTSDQYWDWDMWMRMDSNRKGRECIIPDISRTYHFGAKGLNMNPYFQKSYFSQHRLNEKQGIKFDVAKIQKDAYEKEMHRLVKAATVLDHNKDPCNNKEDFVPNDVKDQTYVFYIQQTRARDWDTWNSIARCLKLWDLDVRGFHKQMWRFWLKENRIIVVGMASEYAKYKPENVRPIYIEDKVRVEREARKKAELEKKKKQ